MLDGGHAWNPDPVLPGFFFVNESAAWNIFVAELELGCADALWALPGKAIDGEAGVSIDGVTPKWMVYSGKSYYWDAFRGTPILGNLQVYLMVPYDFQNWARDA